MSTIEDKKKERNNESKTDPDYATFFLHVATVLITIIVGSFFSAMFMHNISLYARSPLEGTDLYGPPYTPPKPFQKGGGGSFLDNLLDMSEWAFPYKNSFTKPFPKSSEEASSNWWWRTGSWFTMSIAYSFATGRRLLQEIFSGLHATTTSGKFANLKSNFLFMHGQFLLSLLLLLLPLFSIATTIYALGKNAYKLFPNNMFVFFLLLFPIVLFMLTAGSGVVIGVTFTQFIMALLFFYVYPLISSRNLAEMGEVIYEKRNLLTNMLLFFSTLLAFYDLGTMQGIAMVIVFLGFFLRIIA